MSIQKQRRLALFRENVTVSESPIVRAFWDFLRTHITLNEGKTNDGNSI